MIEIHGPLAEYTAGLVAHTAKRAAETADRYRALREKIDSCARVAMQSYAIGDNWSATGLTWWAIGLDRELAVTP